MIQTTVWACKRCGMCGGAEVCQSCGTSRGQMAESDALKLFMRYYEPPTGWKDYDTMRRDWLNGRKS